MIGEVLSNYRVIDQLGEGGMGVVYRAEHTLIGRRAVIKILRPEFSRNPEIVNRFFNEAKSTTSIEHPGIVDIFDFGFHASGSAYIVMELVNGESLAARLARERLPFEVQVAVARRVASAVGAAHAKGIVHRDLKPDNILLTPDPENPGLLRVKVVDFGIAKLAEDAQQQGHVRTRTGSVMGTPAYMSPEQCRGAGRLDHRSDIYSLGCIMYEMACGHRPFEREGMGEIMGAHMYEAPPRPSAFEPSLAPPLEVVILHALAKRPEDRPQTMEALIAELDHVGFRPATAPMDRVATITGPPGAWGPPSYPPARVTTLSHAAAAVGTITTPPPGAARSRRLRAAALVGGLACVAGVVAAVAITGSHRAAPPRAAIPPAPAVAAPAVVAPAPAPAVAAPAPAVVPAPEKPGKPEIAVPEGMVLVPAGTLRQGRDKYRDRPALDVPAHEVAVAALFLDRTEVTNGAYKKFVDAGRVRAPWPERAPFQLLAPLPVVNVTFEDAQAYCRWRLPTGRLPSEPEWEWAARGPEGRLYPWGNEYRRECVNGLDGAEGVIQSSDKHRCGATPSGILDLSGNVWEWTSSPASSYPGSTLPAPGHGFMVVRGGSVFNTDRDELTTTVRQFVKLPNGYLGFRCAADAAAR
jgi:eukaryotic-like serine/threonine-protein kinase